MRVIASIVAISCQLDAHVPVRAIATELVPGFARTKPPRSSRRRESPAAPTRLPGSLRCSCAAGHADACAPRRCRARGSRRPKRPTALAVPARRSGTPADRAVPAQRLGPFEVDGVLGEPQIGITDMTRHRLQLFSAACPELDMSLHLLPGRCFVGHLSSDGSATRFSGVPEKLWPRIRLTRVRGQFGLSGLYLDGAPIHGHDSRGGGGAALALRRNGSGAAASAATRDAPPRRQPRRHGGSATCRQRLRR